MLLASTDGIFSGSIDVFSSFIFLSIRRTASITAPLLTASSGLIFSNTFSSPNIAISICFTYGMRLEPPISTTSSMSPAFMFTLFIRRSRMVLVRSKRSMQRSSNSARDTWKGSTSNDSPFTSTEGSVDSSILVLSAMLRSFCALRLSLKLVSQPKFSSFSFRSAIILASKSSPPRWQSPSVPFTEYTLSSTRRIVQSKVPPPRSYTRIVLFPMFSNPYAMAAAVGSLSTSSTLYPASVPASIVACLWLLLKYAGTVMTISVMSFSLYFFAILTRFPIT